jgi:predicted nucleic acid-binding protein
VIALLDTSVLIALMTPGETSPDLGGIEESNVSALSWAELTAGLHTTRNLATYKERASRLSALQRLFGEGLPFDDGCVEMFGEILSRVSQRGGDPRAHRIDRMLAATAMARDLVLVTRNVADFRILDGLADVVER